MAHLSINVLGELHVSKEDVIISSFESDKVRALLAYLVVEADRSHRRETLVGLLWPDCSEQAARHNLSQALFNLRVALDDHTARPPYLLISRDALQFNRESSYSLDLDQFSACFHAWGKSQGRESADITRLEEMVSLYRGGFLQQFYLEDSAEFEEWLLVQRESLHQRIMNALATLAKEFEKKGDFQAARRYCARQLELDPWREEAHCQLMRLLALDGQRSAALAQYESCRKVLAEELGVEPSQKTRDVYQQICSDSLKTGGEPLSFESSTPIHNLPVLLTPFIGRERELDDLGQLIIDPECRCITLVGPGGIGKTRLALRAAEHHKSKFAHGTFFVPLASVSAVESVIPAIASAISFEFYGPTDLKAQLLKHLGDKQMLLVLDNVEHLLVEGPQSNVFVDLLIEILQKAGRIKLLTTSREALNLQGEWLFEVQGLPFPREEQTEAADHFDSVALFLQRARRARPGFDMNAEDKKGVICLCRLVEGMPLAIELAASWVRTLSTSEIAAEIENSLDFLSSSMRDLPERHRSLRAVFDRSWQTLSLEEKQSLSRLSVFRGGFGRQAAERVAGASLSMLSSLVIRSLLRRTAAARYDLHELVRQYTASKLAEDPSELLSLQEQHGLYYLGWLEEKDATLHSTDQKEALAEMTLEMDNIRSAWEWSLTHGQYLPLYRASTALWYFLELRNWYKEGELTFHKTALTLQAGLKGSHSDRALEIAMNTVLAHSGYFRFRLGRGEEAYAVMAPSAAYLRNSGEHSAAIYSIWYLGIICWQLGKFPEAKENLLECMALTRKYGASWYEALAGQFLGSLAREEGAYNPAQQYLRGALAIFRQLGDPMMISHGLSDLGRILQTLGQLDEAGILLRESFELARELDCRYGMGMAIDGLGQVAGARCSYREAASYFSESTRLFREIGDTYRLSQSLNHQGMNFLSLKNPSEARSAFKASLSMAFKRGLVPITLQALAGLAALEMQQKFYPGTLELVLYILRHPASDQETKDLAEQLRTQLESLLSQPEIESAQAGSLAKGLEEFVAQAHADSPISWTIG